MDDLFLQYNYKIRENIPDKNANGFVQWVFKWNEKKRRILISIWKGKHVGLV